MIFAKKDLIQGDWVILGPKMLCPQNSGSTLKDVLIILHNERDEEAHENQIMVLVFLWIADSLYFVMPVVFIAIDLEH